MMKTLRTICLLLGVGFGQAAEPASTCDGEFPDLINGICYDCMFPVNYGGNLLRFGVAGDDYDSGVGHALMCVCASNLRIGTPGSFWEPRFMVDVTNKPGCMPLLGGVDIDPPYNASEYGNVSAPGRQMGYVGKSAFMHTNMYVNPVMTALGIVTDSPCLDSRSFDTPFISWADPTWGDDALAMMLTPYAYPFAGIASIASEGPDAIAATIGFPFSELFWVAGGWGPMYPLTGNVATATTQEQVAHLLVTRLFAKLHAAGIHQTTAGPDALRSCGAMGVPELVMDKRQYKINRIYPWSDEQCVPVGRPLMYQEAGTSRPHDKDYGYFIFQKKDCCAPIPGVGL